MVFKRQTRPRYGKGFSLIELIVAVAAAMILVLGMGILLAHSQQSFTNMFKRAHSGVVEDAYSVRRVFDRIVRKSTTRRCDLINDSQIYLYFYSDTVNTPNYLLEDPDKYARFYVASGMLFVEYGDASGVLSEVSVTPDRIVQLAEDVQLMADEPVFSVLGRTVQMKLVLDNGKESMLVASTGVRHNK